MNYRKKSIIAVLSSMAMAFLCIFHVSSVETEAAVRVMPLGYNRRILNGRRIPRAAG